jgi:hypothetical protein
MTRLPHPWNPTGDQLLCRDLQHSWSPYTASRKGDGFIRRLICDRCGAFKEQHLSMDGYIVRTSMAYPMGYLRPGEGRLSRSDRAALRLGNIG